jgi:hypothetical protein
MHRFWIHGFIAPLQPGRKESWGAKKERRMRKKIAAVLLASAFALSVPAAALGAEHHPPKFGVHDTQCSSGSNQPNCPGGH